MARPWVVGPAALTPGKRRLKQFSRNSQGGGESERSRGRGNAGNWLIWGSQQGWIVVQGGGGGFCRGSQPHRRASGAGREACSAGGPVCARGSRLSGGGRRIGADGWA